MKQIARATAELVSTLLTNDVPASLIVSTRNVAEILVDTAILEEDRDELELVSSAANDSGPRSA